MRILRSRTRALREANLSFATALVQTLEESDRYTAGHSRAVATYSRDIAEKLGSALDEESSALISLGWYTTSARSGFRRAF